MNLIWFCKVFETVQVVPPELQTVTADHIKPGGERSFQGGKEPVTIFFFNLADFFLPTKKRNSTEFYNQKTSCMLLILIVIISYAGVIFVIGPVQEIRAHRGTDFCRGQKLHNLYIFAWKLFRCVWCRRYGKIDRFFCGFHTLLTS